jgi:hypothetical protein
MKQADDAVTDLREAEERVLADLVQAQPPRNGVLQRAEKIRSRHVK